jgi:hypothetical protein
MKFCRRQRSDMSTGIVSMSMTAAATAAIVLVASSCADAFVPRCGHTPRSPSTTRLYYDIQRDPPNDNVWSVLANTEKWIASTLKNAEESSNSGTNPLSRKEVSYVCETSQDPALILANIFRKLKEARQLGETHGQEQEELAHEQGELSDDCMEMVAHTLGIGRSYSNVLINVPAGTNLFSSFQQTAEKYNKQTLRQTQVLVIPANDDLNDFHVFDQLISAINEARRAARDYITDHSLEKLDDRLYEKEKDDNEWV